MNTAALTPGSSSWRARFLVHRTKTNPLQLHIHDSLREIDYFFHFKSEDAIRHYVNQLRLGYTSVSPDGVLTPAASARP